VPTISKKRSKKNRGTRQTLGEINYKKIATAEIEFFAKFKKKKKI